MFYLLRRILRAVSHRKGSIVYDARAQLPWYFSIIHDITLAILLVTHHPTNTTEIPRKSNSRVQLKLILFDLLYFLLLGHPDGDIYVEFQSSITLFCKHGAASGSAFGVSRDQSAHSAFHDCGHKIAQYGG